MNTSDTVHTDSFEKAAAVAAADQTIQPETAGDPSLPEAEADETQARITQLEAELSATRDQLYRRAADYENLRKRAERDRVQLFQSARVESVKQFLAVNDDLIRTLAVSETLQVQPESFLEGVQLVASKFQQVLAGYNVQLIREEQVPFDVNFHDALLRQPAPDGMAENMVLKVVEPGYRIGETVIRHAKVIVTQ